MARIQAVAPAPGNGSVWRPNAARFDLVGLEAAIEAAVCRAWREEMMAKRKGDVGMNSGPGEESKPAEMAPQQASEATDETPVTSHLSPAQAPCQEALARVLAAVEERALAAYGETQAQAVGLLKEVGHIQRRAATAQGELALAAAKAQEQDETEGKALQEARARAQAALAPYVDAGVVTPEEAEEHLDGAFRQMGEQLQAQRQEAQVRLEALQVEMGQLQARLAELDSRRAALEARLAQLRALPCIASLERARQEEEERRKEAARSGIHFLETAPWHELSWQKKLTPRMKEAVALAGEDPLVFEALVERLGREIDGVDAATRPGLGWSVVRVVEALEMGRLFPNLEAKRAELAQAAQRYHQQRQAQGQAPLADKVVSLASRWGARLAAR